MKLKIREGVYDYIPLNTEIDFECWVQNVHGFSGQINLYLHPISKDPLLEASLIQKVDTCYITKGKGWCAAGTGRAYMTPKLYVFAIFHTKKEHYTFWYCSVSNQLATVKSNVLDLAKNRK